MIFNVQRFSLHDGDGIRTLIFFKGCPLRCAWCSNPESQAFGPEILFDPRKCIACGECVHAAQHGEFILQPIPAPSLEAGLLRSTWRPPSEVASTSHTRPDGGHFGKWTPSHFGERNSPASLEGKIVVQREKIVDPVQFKAICPTKAITVLGEDWSVQALLAEIEKDRPFYRNSGGGVTLSGGEPFAQPEMLMALLKKLNDLDIPISVETCLHAPWQTIEPAANLIDVFLADLKHTNAEKFRTFTGGNLNLVLSNLKQLATRDAHVVIRIPVIPGFNDTEIEMRQILDMAASFVNVPAVHLIPYHALGSQKYALSGRTYTFPSTALTEDALQPYVQYARNKGLKAMIGG